MNLTHRSVNIVGWVSIGVMAVLLVLLQMNVVPQSWTIPFFVIAICLFAARIVMRIILAKQNRQQAPTNNSSS